MPLSDQELDSLAERLSVCLIDSRRAHWVDPETHADHHEYLRDKISSETEMKAFRKKVAESTAVGGLILLLGFLGTAIFQAVANAVIKQAGH